MTNPYIIVHQFEETIARYCGAPYAVAVESGSAAILLSLLWRREQRRLAGVSDDIGIVTLPARTYPSVPCSIIFAGGKVNFVDEPWEGEYELFPLEIWDAALRFKRNMYHGGLQCLSFHVKKLIPIGRGGAILTDSKLAYEWLKKARFDGRAPVPLQEDNFTQLGLNVYMEPTNAARGLQLLQAMGDRDLSDLKVDDQKYPDLSQFKIYTQ